MASGTQDGSNSCNYCDVKLNAFDWSLKLGIEGKNKHINDNRQTEKNGPRSLILILKAKTFRFYSSLSVDKNQIQ